ncbi:MULTISPECIES: DUF6630 family protein [Microbacterium]|uniref:DUF6630 family protein n=1 Tax=Microbacterium TaxID=33882 RepID=UPI00217D352A|nr:MULTISPECIES: hypothetical protein [Microbacterium]UWF77968.1 hypothetical protein JSY13_02635 [Microbacterium neungamense]WCM56145.1 hypothetical protein JRG78_02680 [Microbacterium sp. EF45047]
MDDETRIDAWKRLCELLDDDPELRADVRLAVADPDGYVDAHADALHTRGIASPEDVDPWLVLIDGLDDAGALAYMDRDDTGIELAEALSGVPRAIRSGVDLDEIGDVDGDLPAAIARADELLAPSGLRLLYLQEEPDACPLVVVRASQAEDILSLAAELGRSARVFR